MAQPDLRAPHPHPNPIRVYNLIIDHSEDPQSYVVPFLDRDKAERYAQGHAAFHWPEQWGRCPTLLWRQADVFQVPGHGNPVSLKAISETELSMRQEGHLKFALSEWWL